MTFAEKLKSIRKQAGMSQEQLAEKLSVSRQAVTKWETDAGIPDIENIMAISALFDISIEKIRVRLASNTFSTLQNDFKVKIDDIRKRIDVDVNRKNGVSETTAKEAVSIFVQIPSPYVGKIECAVNAETVEIRSLECDSIELDVKTPYIALADVSGTVEVNCNLDMEIVCRSLNGEIAINQVSATSKIHVPEDTVFMRKTDGRRNASTRPMRRISLN